MTTLRYQQRGKKWYVYELYQYWDKKLKKPRQKSKYLGVAEEKNGAYSKPGRDNALKVESEILDYGDVFALSKIIEEIGLQDIIKTNFGNANSILSLLCFQIIEGAAMHNSIDWYEGSIAKKLFPEAKLTSQNISILIKHLGKTEVQHKFFKNYISKFFPDKRCLLIDSTSLPSAINSSINAFGYASGNIEQNISCLMLVDQKSDLPIYFRAIGGDIPDVATLKTTITEIKHLGLITESALLDAGFCSRENLEFLCSESIDFITRLPKSHKIFTSLVRGAKEIEAVKNAVKYGDRVVFVKTEKIRPYGDEMYAHIIFDPSKKNKDTHIILRDQLSDTLSQKDEENLNRKMELAGFFILLSSKDIHKTRILPEYYNRQAIEQLFSFAKSNNNLLPLRVHSDQSIRGYLMLVFLALITFLSMKRKLQIPMEKALLNLRSLKAKIFDDKVVIQEPNKKVKEIFKSLDIIMPINPGI